MVRVLAVIILVASGMRLIFWLLCPVWPYLLGAIVAIALFRLVRWYRERW